ncbi:hypothetical protein V8D89_001314 [Ganoderma adspersum]
MSRKLRNCVFVAPALAFTWYRLVPEEKVNSALFHSIRINTKKYANVEDFIGILAPCNIRTSRHPIPTTLSLSSISCTSLSAFDLSQHIFWSLVAHSNASSAPNLVGEKATLRRLPRDMPLISPVDLPVLVSMQSISDMLISTPRHAVLVLSVAHSKNGTSLVMGGLCTSGIGNLEIEKHVHRPSCISALCICVRIHNRPLNTSLER